MNENFKQIIADNKKSFYHDLDQIISIRSVKDDSAQQAPFGTEPKRVLERALQLANSYGFKTRIVNDAVGYAQWGDDDENYIGVVGHLDVVPEGDGWSYPPFSLSKDNGKLFGRGILDNKGPIMSCLYGLKLIKEMGISNKRTIRIIFGTDEENGSSDIPMYLKQEQPPFFGFTPDCKYPVVYGERGIVNYEISTKFLKEELAVLGEFVGDQARDHVPDRLSVKVNGKEVKVTGKRAPTNAPELGNNAITLLSQEILSEKLVGGRLEKYFNWIVEALSGKHYGEGLGINFEDEDSGKLIMTPYQLRKKDNQLILSIAIRYPVSVEEDTVTDALNRHLFADSRIKIVRQIKSTNHPKDDPEIQKLSKVYEEVTGLDGTPVTTTGATYARFMPNIVAFGPSFPGQKGIAHNKDEYMDESDLLMNMEIYMNAMLVLMDK